MSKHIYVLDPGHCGLAPGGHYLRKGKQSPSVPPGIYEGEFNRDIARRVRCMLHYADIESCITCPGPVSARDKERIKFVNDLHAKTNNVIYVGIHANAAPGPGWNDSAKGHTIFVSRPRFGTKLSPASMPIARRVHTALTELDRPHRGIKGARFAVLAKTKCPAILCELGFMTHQGEAKWMASEVGRQCIAEALFRGLQAAEK